MLASEIRQGMKVLYEGKPAHVVSHPQQLFCDPWICERLHFDFCQIIPIGKNQTINVLLEKLQAVPSDE